jgi:hypothetical protein
MADAIENTNTDNEGMNPAESREGAVSTPAEDAGDVGSEAKPEEARSPQVKPDSKRNSIYEKARQRREESEGFQAYASPEEERRIVGKNVETSYDRQQRREPGEDQTEQLAEAPEQTRRRKLRVNGQDVELTEDEVTALAQKAYVAGDVLEQAKGYRAQLQAKLEALQQAEAANQSDRQAQAPQPQQSTSEDTKPDDDELDDIIDRIQVGDTNEAKAALEKYGQRLEQRILDRFGDLDKRIADTTRTMSENEARQRQMQTVLSEFQAENSDIANDGALLQAVSYNAVQQMREQMHGLGVQDATIDNIRQQGGFDETQAVAYAYRALQERGYQLPDHGTILRTSAQRIREKFGMSSPRGSNPTPDISGREARKQAMTPQPRRANVAPGANAEANIMDTRREAIRQMRMARKGR